MSSSDIEIIGMTCANCAARIEKGLNKTEGIKKATVNFAIESAHIEYDKKKIKPEDIKEKIIKLGYDSVFKNDKRNAEKLREKEIQHTKEFFLISLVLSLPLLTTMFSHFSFTSFVPVPKIFLNGYFQLLLAAPVQFIIGSRFYIGSFKALKNKSANMDVLVALGTSAAFFFSVYLLFIKNQSHMLYFETSAVLITLIILGKYFEAKAKGKSSSAIKSLLKLKPETATLIKDNIETVIPSAHILVNDIILVKPAEKIPADGVVIEGHSSVDESMLTGESMPVEKNINENVTGGTINKNGILKIKALKVGKDTVLSQIIKTVEDAQSSKAPIQRIADKVSGIFVPVVMMISVLTFAIWFLWLTPGIFALSLEKAIAVLVIACPCALGLATPTSIMAGTGRAAELGILFKSAEHVETAGKINAMVFDKTGTITEGKPKVTKTDIKLENENDFFEIVYTLENKSNHPLAKAIVENLQNKNLRERSISHYETLPGFGIKAVIDNADVLIGSVDLLKENNIETIKEENEIKTLEKQGSSVVAVSVNKKFAGFFALSDTIRENSALAVDKLKIMNIAVFMLTGDNENTAKFIAQKAGIKNVISRVLPNEKANEIKKLQSQGIKTAMVGDGINDAVALTTADIGIAIGSGVDIAIESSNITLVKADINKAVDAIKLSRITMKNIKQNLFWAFAYNSIGIPIAAAGLLAPWLAGAAMAMSSISVVLNALRLQKIKI
ncbi:MAG: heavy metal translocating P-type ATPase [Spirochaetia bacterium]|nr:heavy metal translocating P-type ATPase [Spirochaetia bacterium]